MRYDSYNAAVVDRDLNIYEFASIGPRGTILKRVVFNPTEHSEVFNLAFGDMLTDNTEVTDKTVTDNGDRDKTLATIAKIIDMYTLEHPQHWVNIRGSTASRTRLYQMAIGANFKELDKKYMVYGYNSDGIPELFSKGKSYQAFLVRRKI
jgi:hypothetical protein